MPGLMLQGALLGLGATLLFDLWQAGLARATGQLRRKSGHDVGPAGAECVGSRYRLDRSVCFPRPSVRLSRVGAGPRRPAE